MMQDIDNIHLGVPDDYRYTVANMLLLLSNSLKP